MRPSGGPGAGLAVVLAGAGEGKRMGSEGGKLLLPLGGKTLLERVGATFLAHPEVRELVLVVPKPLEERSRGLLAALPNPNAARVVVVTGGATRQESVAKGLQALERDLPYVAVHDVARALVNEALITRVLEAARETGAAIPALPIRETLKEVEAGRVKRTVPRDDLHGAQTPQIFARDILDRAHACAIGAGATDDSWLVEAMGAPVAVVPGDPSNLKLTEPPDVMLLESHLRIGSGP